MSSSTMKSGRSKKLCYKVIQTGANGDIIKKNSKNKILNFYACKN